LPSLQKCVATIRIPVTTVISYVVPLVLSFPTHSEQVNNSNKNNDIELQVNCQLHVVFHSFTCKAKNNLQLISLWVRKGDKKVPKLKIKFNKGIYLNISAHMHAYDLIKQMKMNWLF
jgi:hypothetical protein